MENKDTTLMNADDLFTLVKDICGEELAGLISQKAVELYCKSSSSSSSYESHNPAVYHH